MADKRSELCLPEEEDLLKYTTALPRCNICTSGRGAGGILLSLFCFCPCSCRGTYFPLYLIVLPFVLSCFLGCFTCNQYTIHISLGTWLCPSRVLPSSWDYLALVRNIQEFRFLPFPKNKWSYPIPEPSVPLLLTQSWDDGMDEVKD